MSYKILIAGETGNHCLEMSYYEAFRSLGHEVHLFDTKKAVQRYVKPHKAMYQLHRFFPVEAWIKKANKDLVNQARSFRPDMILFFTAAEVLPGSFAFLRSILPSTKICWYWADPLPNLNRYIHGSLPLTDIVFSYSHSSLDVFFRMGAPGTGWVPFAGDTEAHYLAAGHRDNYTWDISFIGTWRPERERALQVIHEHFPGLRIRINGPYWERCSYRPLRKIVVNRPLYGAAFSEVVQQSFLNLNVMDDTNYPAVNMRFFEIPVAGGAQLCTASPEMQELFKDRQEVLYFADEQQLVSQIEYAMAHKDVIEKMKVTAQQSVMGGHLYRHRAEAMLKML